LLLLCLFLYRLVLLPEAVTDWEKVPTPLLIHVPHVRFLTGVLGVWFMKRNDNNDNDNDEEEEGNVEHDTVDLVVVAIRFTDFVTDSSASSDTFVKMEYETLKHRFRTFLVHFVVLFLNIEFPEEVESYNRIYIDDDGLFAVVCYRLQDGPQSFEANRDVQQVSSEEEVVVIAKDRKCEIPQTVQKCLNRDGKISMYHRHRVVIGNQHSKRDDRMKNSHESYNVCHVIEILCNLHVFQGVGIFLFFRLVLSTSASYFVGYLATSFLVPFVLQRCATFFFASSAFVFAFLFFFAARFRYDLRVTHIQRIFLESSGPFRHSATTERCYQLCERIWFSLVLVFVHLLQFCVLERLPYMYRKVFNHHFLANILILQPELVIRPRENIYSPMPEIREWGSRKATGKQLEKAPTDKRCATWRLVSGLDSKMLLFSFVHFDELQDIDTPVFFRNMQSQHRYGVLAQHGPTSDVGQLQGVHLKRLIGDSGPLVRLQALDLQPRRELWYHVTFRVLQRRGGPPEFDLKDLLASSLHEDGREQFRIRFHLEFVASFFPLAGEGHPTCRRVHETPDEHSLRGSLARRVLRHFVVQLVCSYHVAALSVDSTISETVVVIRDNHGPLSHARQIEVLGVQMVLRGDPAYVNVRWVLSREDSYPVEVFVHQFQAFCIVYLVPYRLDAASAQHRHSFGRVAFRNLRRYHFQVSLCRKFFVNFTFEKDVGTHWGLRRFRLRIRRLRLAGEESVKQIRGSTPAFLLIVFDVAVHITVAIHVDLADRIVHVATARSIQGTLPRRSSWLVPLHRGRRLFHHLVSFHSILGIVPFDLLNDICAFDLPSSVRPSYPQVWHHMRSLFDVIDGDFEVPLLVQRRVFHSADEYVRPDTGHVIDQLRLKQEILSLTHVVFGLSKIINQVFQTHHHFVEIHDLEEHRRSRHSRDELGEQTAALSDHASCSRLFFLRPGEVQTVVHLAFLVKHGLLLLHFTHALFLRFVRLRHLSLGGHGYQNKVVTDSHLLTLGPLFRCWMHGERADAFRKFFLVCVYKRAKNEREKIKVRTAAESVRYRLGTGSGDQFLQGPHRESLLYYEYALRQVRCDYLIPNIYLVRDILEETVSIAKPLGSEAHPFAGCGAGQTYHVLL
ncbi:hypothetical protein WN48_00484, partial [Eufriesea mexicana]